MVDVDVRVATEFVNYALSTTAVNRGLVNVSLFIFLLVENYTL